MNSNQELPLALCSSQSNGSAVCRANVFPESPPAMAAILDLHFPTGTILDVNFGHGVFYRLKHRERVTGVDIRPTGDVIADNKNLPYDADSFDVGVCDPPYRQGKGSKRGYEHRYGDAPYTEQRVTWSYLAAMPELLRVCRSGMIVKCQDGSDGHRYYPRHVQLCEWMKQQTGLDPHDIAVVARFGGNSAHRQGTPHYMQQTLSYFLIWKWKTKKPYRPVRY